MNNIQADLWDNNMIVNSYEKSSKILINTAGDKFAEETNVKTTTHNKKDHEFCPGDYVRATFSDGIDYEAKLLAVCGEICTISYIGYNNEEQIHASKLVPSWGKKARRMQFENCKKLESISHNSTNEKSRTKNPKTRNQGSKFWIPPPPPLPPTLELLQNNSEELYAMLMAWYMSGYYTGIYQGMTNKEK